MILDTIVADTRRLLERRRFEVSEDDLERVVELELVQAPSDLCAALRSPGVSIVAECKRASPSRGTLRSDLNPRALAAEYVRAGADALSVLTEPTHFYGSPDDLRAIRQAMDGDVERTPILRKDFILSRYQLLEARSWGADAVLLIAAVLDDGRLAELAARAGELGLGCLVEVHDEVELRRVQDLGFSMVGINNRDLRTFEVDLDTTGRLLDHVSSDVCVISESGVKSPKDVRRLASWGVDGALVGEALVTSPDPGATLRALKAAGGTA